MATFAIAHPVEGYAATCAELQAGLVSVSSGGDAKAKRYAGAVKRQRTEIARAKKMLARARCERRESSSCQNLKSRILDMEARARKFERLRDNASVGRNDATRRAAIERQLDRQGCRASTHAKAPAAPTPTRRKQTTRVVQGQPPTSRGNYRTMCVRTCDGYYFPVNNGVGSKSFARDAAQCASMCPAADTRLFVHRSRSDASRMIDLSGRPYTSMPYAHRHQARDYSPSPACSCGRPLAPVSLKAQLRGTAAKEQVPAQAPTRSSSDAETNRNARLGFDWNDAKRMIVTSRQPQSEPRIRVVGPQFFPDR